MQMAMARGARSALALAGLNGLMAVAAGAFGAHGVSDPGVKELLRTGAIYQLAHAAAGIACLGLPPDRKASLASLLAGLGALVFGGSLYLLALTGVRALGAVTPIGGLLMMTGWAVVIWGAFRRSSS